MTEQQTNQQSPAADDHNADPVAERKPFVRPVVVDLGGLEQITLLGGSV